MTCRQANADANPAAACAEGYRTPLALRHDDARFCICHKYVLRLLAPSSRSSSAQYRIHLACLFSIRTQIRHPPQRANWSTGPGGELRAEGKRVNIRFPGHFVQGCHGTFFAPIHHPLANWGDYTTLRRGERLLRRKFTCAAEIPRHRPPTVVTPPRGRPRRWFRTCRPFRRGS